jgi:thiamine transporter
MKQTKTLILVECAIMLGLAVALSFVKIMQSPFGGSVTLLSMLPIALISIKHGLKWGLPVAFLFAAIDLGLSFAKVVSWAQIPTNDGEIISWSLFFGIIFLDYIFAYTVLGLAGIFRKKGFEGQSFGVAFAVTMRFVFHFLSGIILFGEFKEYFPWAEELSVPVYSLIYNGIYMFPEILFTTIGAVVLLKTPHVKRMFSPAVS